MKKNMPNYLQLVMPTTKTIILPNGQSEKMLGEIKLQLKCGEIDVPLTLLVAAIVGPDVIVSKPTMQKLRAEIITYDDKIQFRDLQQNIIFSSDGVVPSVFHIVSSETIEVLVTFPANFVVPANAEMKIPLEFAQVDWDEGQVLIEVVHAAGWPESVMFPKALANAFRHGQCVTITNPLDTEVVVPNGTLRVKLTPIEQDQIALISEAEQGTITNEQAVSIVNERFKEFHEGPFQAELQKTLDSISAEFSPEQYAIIRELFYRNQQAFSLHAEDVGRVTGVQHRIKTTAGPIKMPYRRLPLDKYPIARQEIEKMYKNGVIRPSTSSWSAPVVLVKKKTNDWRFCVDYRALNLVTVVHSYPIPVVSQMLDMLRDQVYYSSIDIRWGYWSIDMAPEDVEKTAFAVPGLGQWEFLKMSFGLRNAAATFQQTLEKILGSSLWRTALVYIDDVITWGQCWEEMVIHLEDVVQKLGTAGLKINASKSKFFAREVEYLGHVVSRAGIAVLPKKIKAVAEWPVPKSTKEVHSFLGFVGYYRNHIKDFSKIAKPLTNLTQQNVPFHWSEEAGRAFELLRERLITAPVLAFPRVNLPYILDTDASDDAIGAVLSQLQDGQEVVIAYYSKKFDKTERNYCTTKRELYGVFLSVMHFKSYLFNVPFTIRVDHKALEWLHRFKDLQGTMGRWLLHLQHFNYSIQYRPGKVHLNADALSRRPCPDSCTQCTRLEEQNELKETEEQPSTLWLGQIQLGPDQLAMVPTLQEIAFQQDLHFETNIVKQFVLLQHWPRNYEVIQYSSYVKTLISHFNTLFIAEFGLLKRRKPTLHGQPVREQIVIPPSLQEQIVSLHHDLPSAGHFGVNRTVQHIQERFFWPKLWETVLEYIRNCEVCVRRKGPNVRNQQVHPPVIHGEPFECLVMDATIVNPSSPSGYRYVLSAVDSFSRFAWSKPLRVVNTQEIVDFLYNDIFTVFGVPRMLKADEDTVNRGELLQGLCRLFQIARPMKIVYNPESRGQVEVFHRSLQDYLAKIVAETNDPFWEKHVPTYLMAYRSTPHSATGISPFEALTGNLMQLPVDFAATETIDTTPRSVTPQYLKELKQRIEETRAYMREKNAWPLHAESPLSYPVNILPQFQNGQPVWYKKPCKVRDRTKLRVPWTPAVVLNRLPNSLVTYLIRVSPNKTVLSHVKWLGPRRPNEHPY